MWFNILGIHLKLYPSDISAQDLNSDSLNCVPWIPKGLNSSQRWGHSGWDREQTCSWTHTPPSLNSAKATLLLVDLFLSPHNISSAQNIMQLKSTDLEPLVLIKTFLKCAFHMTKSTAALKVYIVHFLYKSISPSLHSITLLRTK